VPIESFESLTPRVHPAAFVHGAATLIGDVEVGEEASIWPSVALRGDHGLIRIGARTSIQDGSVAHATEGESQTLIGAGCTVGHRVVLHGCRVGDNCLVGMGSVVMDNAELGEWSFLAAGSLVPPGKVYPPRSFILGSPGRRLREVTEKEIEWIQHSMRAYVDLARRYRRA
jgi:carbonic anhydrase/acetyltransferase-like protein (isoleucine patch superfamily)